MNKRNTYFIVAGLINLFTALLHTVGGQLSLVDPLLSSDLMTRTKTEWLGVWHMITILLFATSFYLLKAGLAKGATININTEILKPIGVLYFLFGAPFILSSILMKTFAPQWILFLPIAILTFVGLRKVLPNKA